MKHLFILIVLTLLSSCASRREVSRISLSIDGAFSQKDQVCYIDGFKSWISGNETAIFDSCKIRKNQKKARFKIEHPEEAEFGIIFSEAGINQSFTLRPNAKVKMQIQPIFNQQKKGKMIIKGKGSEAYNEDLTFREKKIYPLIDKIDKCESLDSILYYKKIISQEAVKIIKETQYPTTAIGNWWVLRNEYKEEVGGEEGLQKLKDYLKQKFPNFSGLGMNSNNLPASTQSKIDGQRIRRVLNAIDEAYKQDTTIGSKIDLALYDSNNKLVPLNQINEEYILIDIWASWCKPCQKEIPYLKEVLNKYKDKLCIYAISIDRHFNAWQNAIQRDSTQNFTHVMGADAKGLPNQYIQGLGVKSIPANFLLNSKHQIIAKNLRGEQLIQTLDSLIKQNVNP